MEKISIQVFLKDFEEVTHPFNKDTLNPTLANFLYEECLGKRRNLPIEIQILTKHRLNSKKQEEITNLIHKHFQEEAKEEYNKTKIVFEFYFFTLIIGLFLIVFALYTKSSFFKEILTILAWVAIWEAVSSFTFHQFKESIKYHRMKQLSKAYLSFETE